LQCDIQTAPHQGDNLLQGTEIVTSPPNMQAPSGAAYSVLDGSTNKAHKSVTGKRLVSCQAIYLDCYSRTISSLLHACHGTKLFIGLGHHLPTRLPRNFLEMKTQEMTMLLVLETLMPSSGIPFFSCSAFGHERHQLWRPAFGN
jgi:hypothetical protein